MQTIDDILAVLQEDAQNRVAVDPAFYLEAGLKLMSLVGVESDRLYELESAVANFKSMLMEEPSMTAAKAKIRAEASPQYLEARKLKAKIERIYEMVRLSKARARIGQEEFKSH